LEIFFSHGYSPFDSTAQVYADILASHPHLERIEVIHQPKVDQTPNPQDHPNRIRPTPLLQEADALRAEAQFLY
jgi:hypothetical protein